MSLSQFARSSGLRLWRGGRLAWRVLVGVLLAGASLCLLAWLTLHWGILPHIDEWRPRVEALAARSIGAPVRIGRIAVRAGGWVPAFELHDVALLDAQGREALKLPHVSSALSVPALLALELRFEQLLIEDAELEVRRDAQGRIRVAGLDMDGASAGGDAGELADWFFEQHEFVIRRGTVRWVDELRRAPPLALTDVQLVVRNGLKRHDLRLDATPPVAWGERFTLQARMRQPLLARAGQWQRWSGDAHVTLPRADVGELQRYVDLPFELRQGGGALRLWLELRDGEPRAVTADLALRDVSLRLGRSVGPLSIAELSGRLGAERSDTQLRMTASHFRFVTGEGVAWPEAALQLKLAQRATPVGAPQAPVTGGELTADRLQFAPLAAIVDRLPVGDGVRRLLAGMAPQGSAQDLAARWDGPLDAPRQYQVKALLKGVTIAAAASPQAQGIGRPGVRNADIDLLAGEAGGEARLVVADGAIEFPGVFEQPEVPLRRLDAALSWRLTPSRVAGEPAQVELKVKEARFDNDDAQGELAGSWRTGAAPGHGKGARLPGVLDLAGKLSRGRATAVARYLPLGIPQAARDYVRHAVQAGDVTSATFKVKGDVWDFPFYNQRDGEFQIAGQVRDVTLAYVPGVPAGAGAGEPARASPWPAFTQAQAELVFDRRSMTIRKGRAQMWGVALTDVEGRIADLSDDGVLRIEGVGRGPMADMLRYVDSTPVGGWISGALAETRASGAGELRLALELPLHRLAQSTVKGSVTLAGNDVRMSPDTPPLEAARGRVDFTHKGVQVVGATARLLGGEASFGGGSQPDGSLRFQGQGTATAEGLRRGAGLPAAVASLGAVLRGQADYRAQLGFVHGRPELLVTSALQGLGIDLPTPLGKAPEVALPLKLQTSSLAEPAPGQSPLARDQLRIELGQIAQALYVRDVSGDAPRVLRSALAVNAPLPTPIAGGQAVLNLASVNADAWQAAWGRLAAGGSPLAGSAGDGYFPRTIALKAGELVAGQRKLTHLVLGLTHQAADGGDSTWRANVEADQVGGYVEYRQPGAASAAGRVFARLGRLSLPPADAAEVETLLDRAPASVPALDIVIDDFELRGRKLGRLELEAVNRGVATGDGPRDAPREWRLTRLGLRLPEAQLTGSGQWSAVPGSTRRRMVLDFRLDLADSGALLERLGFGRVVRGGKGRLQGQVGWDGSPLSLDIPSLDGQVNLVLESGQFLKADAGAARLLGVVSLQALPRRLALDFRDVFEEGFAFDQASGDLHIDDGLASTNNLRLRGVQAAVLMEGRADIARETQNLRVVVVPEINAGTASLAYAAINPAVGLGTFLAQWVLRRPLQAATTREFRITGGWADPQVERVQRAPGEPAPDVDAPAAAASRPPSHP